MKVLSILNQIYPKWLSSYLSALDFCNSPVWNIHCDQVNDFPVIKGTPGIFHDPIDLLEVRFQTEVGIVYQYLQYAPPFVNEISIC